MIRNPSILCLFTDSKQINKSITIFHHIVKLLPFITFPFGHCFISPGVFNCLSFSYTICLSHIFNLKRNLFLFEHTIPSASESSDYFMDQLIKHAQLLLSLSSFFLPVPDPGCLADLQIQEPERPSC